MPFDDYITVQLQPQQADFYLQQGFPFYKELNAHNKSLFISRLCTFVERKKFVPRKGLVFTDEMATISCACAIQLTFGLQYFTIDYFETILLYPDVYTSPHTDKKHHGEVNLGGFLCFSWASLKKGVGKNDNFNVGLHEWSHALRFNGFKGHDGDAFFDTYFIKWLAVGNKLYNNIRTGRNTYFNKYGGSNLGEFFPVMMEHFFENPEYFREHHPIEFESCCVLLNMDPCNAMNPVSDVRRKLFSLFSYTNSQTVYMKSHHGKAYLSFTVPAIALFLIAIGVADDSLLCAAFIFVLALVPFVLFFAGKYRKVQMTENGLLRGSKSLNPFDVRTKKYSWEQVIQADFGEPVSKDGTNYTYPYVHFTVWDDDEFKILKFHQSVSEQEAQNYKKMFREKGVAALLRNTTPRYLPGNGFPPADF